MKLYKDLYLAKAMRITKDKLIIYLIEQHHRLCEEEITDDEFRENVKLILR